MGPAGWGMGQVFHMGSGSQGPIEGAYHRYRFKRDCTEMGQTAEAELAPVTVRLKVLACAPWRHEHGEWGEPLLLELY